MVLPIPVVEAGLLLLLLMMMMMMLLEVGKRLSLMILSILPLSGPPWGDQPIV